MKTIRRMSVISSFYWERFPYNSLENSQWFMVAITLVLVRIYDWFIFHLFLAVNLFSLNTDWLNVCWCSGWSFMQKYFSCSSHEMDLHTPSDYGQKRFRQINWYPRWSYCGRDLYLRLVEEKNNRNRGMLWSSKYRMG